MAHSPPSAVLDFNSGCPPFAEVIFWLHPAPAMFCFHLAAASFIICRSRPDPSMSAVGGRIILLRTCAKSPIAIPHAASSLLICVCARLHLLIYPFAPCLLLAAHHPPPSSFPSIHPTPQTRPILNPGAPRDGHGLGTSASSSTLS